MRQKTGLYLVFLVLGPWLIGIAYAMIINERTLSQDMLSIIAAFAAQSLWVQIFFVGEIINKVLEYAINFASISTILFEPNTPKKERIEIAFMSFLGLFFLVTIVIIIRLKLSAVLIAIFPYLIAYFILPRVIKILSLLVFYIRCNGSYMDLRSPLKTIISCFQNGFSFSEFIFGAYKYNLKSSLDVLLSRKALASHCVSSGKEMIWRYRCNRPLYLARLRSILNFGGQRP
jgi:hypothetical protein